MATQWIYPNHFPKGTSAEVHVWKISLKNNNELSDDLLVSLCAEEVVRARRFKREQDGACFATMRRALRCLLGQYLKKDGAALSFTYNEYGKPDLDSSPIQFNVSHSGDIGLIAIHPEQIVGVDVERHRENLEAEKIARRYFSSAEVEALFTLPESEQKAAFYRCWSRKEAYIKARGEGLALGLDNFDVSLRPDEPAVLLRAPGGVDEISRWEMYALPVEVGYAGALMVEKPEVAVRLFEFIE